MIKGFEEYTVELNDSEKKIAERVAIGLKKKIGKANAITNLQMRTALAKEGMIVADATMRKIIEYLRQNFIVCRLAACSKGYFIAVDDKEWNDWLTSMEQRGKSIMYTLHCAKESDKHKDF